jgi:hypothetical protein
MWWKIRPESKIFPKYKIFKLSVRFSPELWLFLSATVQQSATLFCGRGIIPVVQEVVKQQ